MSANQPDQAPELDRLRQENERLRAELSRLHAGVRFSTMATGASVTGHLAGTVAGKSTGTVMGIEEMILQVGPDRSIGYINAPMAKLLGIRERRSVLGEPLANWDKGPFGEGTLRSVVDAALATSETVAIERVCPGLDESLLPGQGVKRPACDPILRFVANAVRGRVELVAQDVTRLRWLESTFARYVAPEIIEQMLLRSEEDFMDMERREISVLFVDLRGFTRITQQLEPHVLQEMINQFLSNMVACIKRFNGTVDKFVGDEVMALFGAPVSVGDHALRALLAALDMQTSHAEMMRQWAAADRPAAGIGIGVTTGEAFVGNIGTETRMDFTALGHTVNMAARLCGKAEAGEILTISATYRHAAEALKTTQLEPLPRFKFSPRGKHEFKNVDEPVTVLAVSVA
jgi:class 3 adenylate cyclase